MRDGLADLHRVVFLFAQRARGGEVLLKEEITAALLNACRSAQHQAQKKFNGRGNLFSDQPSYLTLTALGGRYLPGVVLRKLNQINTSTEIAL